MSRNFAGCFTLIMMLTAAANDEFQQTPPTSVSELPHRAWDGKTEPKMDGPFADAAVRLFNASMPDPVGLPYHKITISTGNCYTGDDGIMATHGWMLPAKADMQRFAIAWNGLVYPVVKDSGKADFNTDAQAILEKARKWLAPTFSPMARRATSHTRCPVQCTESTSRVLAGAM